MSNSRKKGHRPALLRRHPPRLPAPRRLRPQQLHRPARSRRPHPHPAAQRHQNHQLRPRLQPRRHTEPRAPDPPRLPRPPPHGGPLAPPDLPHAATCWRASPPPTAPSSTPSSTTPASSSLRPTPAPTPSASTSRARPSPTCMLLAVITTPSRSLRPRIGPPRKACRTSSSTFRSTPTPARTNAPLLLARHRSCTGAHRDWPRSDERPVS